MRTHLLSKDLFARLFLLIEVLDHVLKRAEGLVLFFMREQRAGIGINSQGRLATWTDDGKTVGITHSFQIRRLKLEG